jgi:hypothetical protein
VLEKSSEDRRVNALASEMQKSIADVAGPRGLHDTRESWLARAARRCGISPRRAKAFFYGEVSNPRHSDVEKVRAAVLKHNPAEMRRAGVTHEFEQLRQRVERLETLLAASRSERRSSPG